MRIDGKKQGMAVGIRHKIFAGVIALLLIQGMVILFWVSQVMKSSLLEEIRKRGLSTGASLAARLVEPVLAMDFFRMKILVDEIMRIEDDMFYVFVLDLDGMPMVHSFDSAFPVDLLTVNPVREDDRTSMALLDTGRELVYDYAVPVLIGENRLGTLRFGLLRTRARRAVYTVMISAAAAIVLSILIAGIFGAVLLNPIVRRIKTLYQSTEHALRGNLKVRTAPLLKRNCWDIMGCGKTDCPAYENRQQRCWYLAGTLCPTCTEGEFAGKIDSCRQCPVYRQCSGDELQSLAESFDAMILSLDSHLSELQQAKITLNEQKALLQTILDAIPDLVSFQDQRGVYISVNRSFCGLLGKPADRITGRTNADLFSFAAAEQYTEEDRQILSDRKILDKELHLNRNGLSRWLHVVKVPVFDSAGRIIGIVCSGRDITQLKQVQDQLSHALKMESLGRLAAGVAHEINTPLGIILGYAQMLLEDVEEQGQVHDDLSMIVKQTRICSKIVADLLKFSRVSGSLIRVFDIHEVIVEVVEMMDHTLALNRITIHRSFYGSDLRVRGDREKLKQVFVNLLNNAFDAIGESGDITIVTGMDRQKNVICVSVCDTGHGVDPANLKKIFDPFFTTKGPDKGTGLGLSVTFGIIEDHQGRIQVFSPPVSPDTGDRGTEFRIELPPADGETGGRPADDIRTENSEEKDK